MLTYRKFILNCFCTINYTKYQIIAGILFRLEKKEFVDPSTIHLLLIIERPCPDFDGIINDYSHNNKGINNVTKNIIVNFLLMYL